MKRVLKRLTGAPPGPIPPGAWLTVLAGAVALLGWGVLREPASTPIGTAATAGGADPTIGHGSDSDRSAAQDLRPGGLLQTETPDRAQLLVEFDEATLRLRLRALSGGGDDACPDTTPAPRAVPSAPGDPIADEADLRVSPRITGWPGDQSVDDPRCPPGARTLFGAGDGSGAAEP